MGKEDPIDCFQPHRDMPANLFPLGGDSSPIPLWLHRKANESMLAEVPLHQAGYSPQPKDGHFGALANVAKELHVT